MSHLEKAPAPPADFTPSHEEGLVTNHVLGSGLVATQKEAISREFESDYRTQEQTYWDDIREFYDIDQEDAGSLNLQTVAEKYEFSDHSREHTIIRGIGDLTIHGAQQTSEQMAEFLQQGDYGNENLDRNIRSTRDQLREQLSDTTNHETLDMYLETDAVPAIFQDWRTAEDGGRVGWAEWLTDRATPDQFMNFVQWHNDHMEQVNASPETREAIAQQKQEYKDMLTMFGEQGFLAVDDDIYQRVDEVKVDVGDVFSTTIKGRGGYRSDSTGGNIVVSPNVTLGTKHELNHAVLGKFGFRWLDEATTEHVAVAMKQGSMEDVEAFLEEDLGVYKQERELLSTIMTQGSEAISVQALLKGYTEDTPDSSKDAFTAAVDQSWGEDALEKVQVAIEKYTETYKAEQHSEHEAQEMALAMVRSDLTTQPVHIFGDGYIRPASI